jgi:hypothetical protein
MNTSKKSSTYKVDVLETNKSFKTAVRSVGTGLSLLIHSGVLPGDMAKIAKKCKSNDELYKKLDGMTRRIKTKDGNFVTPFTILQALYRMKD